MDPKTSKAKPKIVEVDVPEVYTKESFLEAVEQVLSVVDIDNFGYGGEEKTSYGEEITPTMVFGALMQTLCNLQDCDCPRCSMIFNNNEKALVFFLLGMRNILNAKEEEREAMILRYFCITSSLLAFQTEQTIKEFLGSFQKIELDSDQAHGKQIH